MRATFDAIRTWIWPVLLVAVIVLWAGLPLWTCLAGMPRSPWDWVYTAVGLLLTPVVAGAIYGTMKRRGVDRHATIVLTVLFPVVGPIVLVLMAAWLALQAPVWLARTLWRFGREIANVRG